MQSISGTFSGVRLTGRGLHLLSRQWTGCCPKQHLDNGHHGLIICGTEWVKQRENE